MIGFPIGKVGLSMCLGKVTGPGAPTVLEKVGEGSRRFEKVREGWRRLEKVREG